MESVMTERSSSPWGQSRRQILDLSAQMLQSFVETLLVMGIISSRAAFKPWAKVWVRVNGRHRGTSVPLRSTRLWS